MYLMASVSTWGGLGNITNWQQHNIPGQILPQIRQVINISGDSLWTNGLFKDEIDTISRIIVPSPQTLLQEGNEYTLKVICLNVEPETAEIFWRPLGGKKFNRADLIKSSDTWWTATIPDESISEDFEYYIIIKDRKNYVFPASAPEVNHAVVMLKE
jgi:hypothetical protein